MALILTTAFIAIIALALPNPKPTINILPPKLPQPLGSRSGAPFSLDLTFTIYAEPDCNGEPAGVYTSSYGFYEAYQMQSYHLSRALLWPETLDFFAGIGGDDEPANHTIDHTLDGHYTESCLLFDVRAGVNATTHDKGVDDPAESHGRNVGCHTLVRNEWCANIWTK